MPGTYSSFYVAAFDLDAHGEPVNATETRTASSEAEAAELTRQIALRHAGAVAWKRQSNPVVGEEGDPIIIAQFGRVGDFDSMTVPSVRS